MLAIVLSLATAATPSIGWRTGPQQLPQATAQVGAENFAAWRDHIAPHASEQRWLEIDWHDSISTGVQAATEQQRPMLLWLMNGHPATETKPLKLLSGHASTVVSRRVAVEHLLGSSAPRTVRPLDNVVLHLRKLFEKDPGNPRHLHTVRGVGFRFEA